MSNSENYDKAILTLSTGILGISMAFIKDVVPYESTRHIELIVLSWIFLGLAIMFTLSSFIISQKGIKKQLFFAEQYYLNKREEFCNKKNCFAIATDIINFVSGIFFLFAIILSIYFISINMMEETKMSEKNKIVRVPGGMTIPNLQVIDNDEVEKKGAPIPNLQPIVNTGETQENNDDISSSNLSSNSAESIDEE